MKLICELLGVESDVVLFSAVAGVILFLWLSEFFCRSFLVLVWIVAKNNNREVKCDKIYRVFGEFFFLNWCFYSVFEIKVKEEKMRKEFIKF